MPSNTRVREALRWGMTQLKKAGVETPVLDAELLLTYSAIPQNRRIDRAWLYAHPEQKLTNLKLKTYKLSVARRVKREPLAYIVGQQEFFGLDFFVNKAVIIPRPETEMIVEEAIKEIKRLSDKDTTDSIAQSLHRSVAIIDVGTGSGAIAVALAVEFRMKNIECRMYATDISADVLRVARRNARRHGVEQQINLLRGNLLAPLKALWSNSHGRENLTTPFHLIVVANLPYLTTAEWRATAPEIKKWEPRGALDGGKDGLKYYRELFEQVECKMKNVKCKMIVLCEICPEQAGAFKKIVQTYFPKAKFEVIKDLAGRKRVAVVRLDNRTRPVPRSGASGCHGTTGY